METGRSANEPRRYSAQIRVCRGDKKEVGLIGLELSGVKEAAAAF